MAQSLSVLAELLCDKGDYAGAETRYREASDMTSGDRPGEAVHVLARGLGLARALVGLARFAEAERRLRALNRQLETLRPPPPPNLRQKVVEERVALYRAWHAAEPDQGYDTKAKDWQARLESGPARNARRRPPPRRRP